MAKVAINGFGRLGKCVLKTVLERQPVKLLPCAINDPGLENAKHAAYIFKHDTTQGRFYGRVCADDKYLIVNNIKILVCKETDIKKVPWGAESPEYVIECTSKYNKSADAQKLLQGTVKKVLIAASSPDAPMYVLGVNEKDYKSSDKIVSMASCTTNCLAPLAKVVNDKFGIREGFMTTVHAIISAQRLLDGVGAKSWRLGRSAFLNIIPTPSGAVAAIGKVLPDLNGKIAGLALRVPTPMCSIVDFTVKLCKATKLEEINCAIKEASRCTMSGILCYSDEMVVSSDFIGCSCSSIYDAQSSMQLTGNFFKLFAWFDNEYGYACRVADFLAFMHDKELEKCGDKKKGNEKSKTKENKPVIIPQTI